MNLSFETSVTKRLLSGALMIGGFAASASGQYVASRPAVPMPGGTQGPLAYVDAIEHTSLNGRELETAHMLKYMIKLSEDLNMMVLDSDNDTATATRRLKIELKKLEESTSYQYQPFPLQLRPSFCNMKRDLHDLKACLQREEIAKVTRAIAMADAELFQAEGVKAESQIQQDFDAMNLFKQRVNAIGNFKYP